MFSSYLISLAFNFEICSITYIRDLISFYVYVHVTFLCEWQKGFSSINIILKLCI